MTFLDTIYVCDQQRCGLRAFAAEFCKRYGAADSETRLSDNYAGGEYVKVRVLGLTIKLMLTDSRNFAEFEFAITFDGPSKLQSDSQDSLAELPDFFCRVMTLDGYEVARDPDAGRIGGRKLVYRMADGVPTCEQQARGAGS